MKPKYQIIFGFILCLSLAGFAYLWAINLMESLYNYRSPISKTPPIPGESTGPSITTKVVIILIDALRVDTAYDSKVMPFLNKLKNNSAWGIMHSQPPSYSEPGWTTILTGAWPEISDGPAVNLEYENIYPLSQDNLFSASQRYEIKTAISGYYWFEKLLPQGAVDKEFYTEGEDHKADQEVVTAAIPWLTGDSINLLLIHLDQVDFAGHHEGGPRSNNWNEAATRVDSLVHSIVDELDLTQDTILILSDHGQIDSGGHGGQEAVVLSEPFIFSGKGIIPGNYPDIQMVDIAPTISVLLGLNIPAVNQGQPLVEILNINTEKTLLINAALADQQNQLFTMYLTAIGTKAISSSGENVVSSPRNSILATRNDRLRLEILTRSFYILVFFGFLIFFLLRYVEMKIIISYLLTGIGYVLLFNFRYIILDKYPFSLSWITSQNHLVLYLAVTSFIAFTLSWLLNTIFTKTFNKTRQEMVRDTILTTISTILIVAFPVYISFAINGPLVSWTLPNMPSMYLAFISLLQCMFIAIIGCALSILTIPLHLIVRKFAGVNIYEN